MDSPITRAEHDEFVKRMQEENNRQNHRLKEIEEDIHQLTDLIRVVDKLAVNMDLMLKEQNKQGERLSSLENRDGEMWRNVVAYAVTAIIGILIGFVFSLIGLT